MADCCALKIAGDVIGEICCNAATKSISFDKLIPIIISVLAFFVSIYNVYWLPKKHKAFDVLSEFLSAEMRDHWTRSIKVLTKWNKVDLPRLRNVVDQDRSDQKPIEQRFTRNRNLDGFLYVSSSGETGRLDSIIDVLVEKLGVPNKMQAAEILLEADDDHLHLFLFLDYLFGKIHPDGQTRADILAIEQKATKESLQQVENFFYRMARLYNSNVVSRKYCRRLLREDFTDIMEAKGFRTICEQMSQTTLCDHGNFSWAVLLPKFLDRMNKDAFWHFERSKKSVDHAES